jgi:hypothetical protein
MLGVRRWRELVTDRDKWRGIARQATAGCSANVRRRRISLKIKNIPVNSL